MAATTTTDEVLSSARQDLQAQLSVVRDELARLSTEERTLSQALSALEGPKAAAGTNGGATESKPRTSATQRKRSARKPAARGRRRRSTNKSTGDRVQELRGLLGEGPKSRNDLAAALKVSPARVQQLLAELGGSVSSQPDPSNGRARLWSLKGSGNGASSGKRAASSGGRQRRGTAGRRPRSGGAAK